ncbi:MAG: hypothetical protein JNL79_38490 [Myxococcales bacterium]|nr:hypothetical protein [Myxococcales bacterium]
MARRAPFVLLAVVGLAAPAVAADALYPLTFRANVALDPGGTVGRWGVGVDRLPKGGFGVGFGISTGFANMAKPEGAPANMPANSGAFLEPIVRPGYVFAVDGEVRVTGWVGVGVAPVIDFLERGKRLSIIAEPAFLMAVSRFAFGLSLRIGGVATSSVPDESGGFSLGFGIALGAMF